MNELKTIKQKSKFKKFDLIVIHKKFCCVVTDYEVLITNYNINDHRKRLGRTILLLELLRISNPTYVETWLCYYDNRLFTVFIYENEKEHYYELIRF